MEIIIGSCDSCSGTLIAPDWVLTAAHCVSASVVGYSSQAELASVTTVHFDTLDIYSDPGTQVKVSEAFPDPDFDYDHFGMHDAGLIHLATPVTNITPTLLNFDAANAPVGIPVTMVGYGQEVSGDSGPDGVQDSVQQTSVTCSSVPPQPDDPTLNDADLLCFDLSSGKGGCYGDSGGPVFAHESGNRLLEVGTFSFGGVGCVQFNAAQRIDAEKAFITSHVTDLCCDPATDCVEGPECKSGGCNVGGEGGAAMVVVVLGMCGRRRRR